MGVENQRDLRRSTVLETADGWKEYIERGNGVVEFDNALI